MMARNTLMIGDRLVIDKAAMGGVGYRNRDAARTFAIRRSTLVMRSSGGLERRNRLDRDCGLWQQIEELRQVRLHLCDVFAEVLDDSFRRGGPIFRVLFDVFAEAGEIFVAVRFGQCGHLSGNPVNLLQANLVDLCRCEVRSGEAAQCGLVPARATAKRIDGKCRSAVRYIVGSDKGGELLVRRKNFAVNRRSDLVRETFLIRIGKAGRKFFERKNEWIGGDHALRLPRNLFGDEAYWDKMIAQTGFQNALRLQERLGNLVQASDV